MNIDKYGTPFTPIRNERSLKYTVACPRCGAPAGHYCNKERVNPMQNISKMEPHKERVV